MIGRRSNFKFNLSCQSVEHRQGRTSRQSTVLDQNERAVHIQNKLCGRRRAKREVLTIISDHFTLVDALELRALIIGLLLECLVLSVRRCIGVDDFNRLHAGAKTVLRIVIDDSDHPVILCVLRLGELTCVPGWRRE